MYKEIRNRAGAKPKSEKSANMTFINEKFNIKNTEFDAYSKSAVKVAKMFLQKSYWHNHERVQIIWFSTF